ncbi:GGDEF domain-containing protein [Alkalimarinus sediminis]|uniref:diguanylate cyclase n=1 Tax=Alkalimarinus sediminis TaxID=1632866 RepID=A0A9E8KR38_9ALTE|nr:GGDEF domain-containing protein [Alkalimarinus sediminis]UZW75577.1 GGDEF domain-containing protein [Alkalimarinus sediminis]
MKRYVDERFIPIATQQLYQDLATRSFPGVIFYMAVWAALILPKAEYFFAEPRIHTTLILTAIISASAITRLLCIYTFRIQFKNHNTCNGNILLLGVIISSLAWGLCSAQLIMTASFQDAIASTMIAGAGLCAGGLASLAPSRRFLICFLVPMLIPSSIAILLVGHPFSASYAALSGLLLCGLYGISGIQRREYFNALESQYELEEKSDQLAELNTLDPLTGLKNKRFFDEKMTDEFNRAIRDNSPISLILIDLDHFKKVNDLHGHLVGDECLKEMSRALKAKFNRAIDTLARVGGEEFAVLLPTIHQDQAMALADKLRKQIEQISISCEDCDVSLTASLGVSTLYPSEESSAQELFKRADLALYEAKRLGRNQVARAPATDDYSGVTGRSTSSC